MSRKQPPPAGTVKPDPPLAPPLQVGRVTTSVEARFSDPSGKLLAVMERAAAAAVPAIDADLIAAIRAALAAGCSAEDLIAAANRARTDELAKSHCTGVAASWCPVHGDCTCPVGPDGVSRGDLDSPDCPLHSAESSHGANAEDAEGAELPSTDNCHSYNCPERAGSTPEVVLDPRPHGWGTRSVCVDACLAPAIEALWRAGIVTSGCCCGHGGRVLATPEIMVDDPRRVPEACAIVAAIDRRPVKVICYSKEACDSAGGLGILSLPEAEPARPWVYCADAEPAEAGRYEAAICGAAPCRLNFSPLHGWEWSGVFPPAVYAWRASDGAVPSIRPADRSYLLTQGVPAEWLGAPEED